MALHLEGALPWDAPLDFKRILGKRTLAVRLHQEIETEDYGESKSDKDLMFLDAN
jgi:hypothetical protein